MSFSAEWLALREPADHVARSASLLAALGEHFAGREEVHVVDLGSGAGSNLRGTFAALPARQTWHLVDHDPALLAAAREDLAQWADTAEERGESLLVAKDGRRIVVTFRRADLNNDLDDALPEGADLVTAAALFDLVSPAWIARFVPLLARRRLPLYTVLTYDGRQRWEPPHPADAAMLAAFNAHQATDKGFGPAAGPRAAGLLGQAFEGAGYAVRRAPSPWRLEAACPLARELATGFAGAVRETARVPAATVEAWLAARLPGGACEVGHEDIFAAPR